MVKKAPDRGDIVYMNFNPNSGHEQAGHNPAIVLSPKLFNEAQAFAIVCPITSKSKNYPFEVAIPEGLKTNGVILTDQVRSLDWRSRNLKFVEKSPEGLSDECFELINTILY